MRTEYKVNKPFGCAKVGDIFKLDMDEMEYVMENTKSTKKGTNSRYMSINIEYVDALVNNGCLTPSGYEFLIEDNEDNEDNKEKEVKLPSVAELKLMALEAFLEDCAKKYQSNLNKIEADYEQGKVQPCVKVESETVNYNLLKFIKAVKQILDVDKVNE